MSLGENNQSGQRTKHEMMLDVYVRQVLPGVRSCSWMDRFNRAAVGSHGVFSVSSTVRISSLLPTEHLVPAV